MEHFKTWSFDDLLTYCKGIPSNIDWDNVKRTERYYLITIIAHHLKIIN